MNDLAAVLAAALDRLPPGPLLLGFSGGADSHVLLHLLAASPAARARGLRALHVDHALQPESARWAAHCADVAAGRDVPLAIERVQVDDAAGIGLEAAARAARHAAFARHLQAGAILVLAHHRDDQVETVLLRLLHAAGHEGVAGMRAWRSFGPGWLWRPLLEQPRAALQAWAGAHGLRSIDDPANADPRFARNRLRHDVLPALHAAWPDADARIAAAARRLREDSDTLDAIARTHLADLHDGRAGTLALDGVRTLPDALRRRVIGLWLDARGRPRPPPGIWRRLGPDLLDAREDATPLLAWRGAELRRHRDALFALRPQSAPARGWRAAWDGRGTAPLPPGFGRLALDPPQPFDPPLTVAPRSGGERLLQHGLHRPLRLRLQELGVPPWRRARLPLLFDADGTLLAVADLAAADTFAAWLQAHGARLHWQPDD